MPAKHTRDELVARLIRAGEIEVTGEDLDTVETYFDPARFAFHGPAGFETDFAGLQEYFSALRDAFSERSIRRGIVVVEGDRIGCQTWIEGTFTRPFTHSPAGRLEPNGRRVVWDLINLFQFDAQGRLIEEWVRVDNQGLLEQLQAPAVATSDGSS